MLSLNGSLCVTLQKGASLSIVCVKAAKLKKPRFKFGLGVQDQWMPLPFGRRAFQSLSTLVFQSEY